MIDGRIDANQGTERVALDVKVINAVGANHFDETLQGPQVAASNYRDFACEHQQTRSRCAEKGLRFEPIVFTAQGGVEPHGEALLTQICSAIATVEGGDAATIKAEMLRPFSVTIARSVARSVLRRRRHRYGARFESRAVRLHSEVVANAHDDDDDDVWA